MKKIFLLIAAVITAVVANAQPITNINQLEPISISQRYIKIKEDRGQKTSSGYNDRLSQISSKMNGDVVIIINETEVYDGFYRDFYRYNGYNAQRGMAFVDDVAGNSYGIYGFGDLKEYQDEAKQLLGDFLKSKKIESDYDVYDFFIDSIMPQMISSHSLDTYKPVDNSTTNNAVDLPDDNWGKYIIGQRTEQNPLVFKSFLKDNLTDTQRKLALETPYVDTAVKVYDAAGLLSDDEIAKLQKRIHQFVNKYNIDMVVVTINHNNKTDMNGELPSDNYAMDFYEYNDFGKGIQAKNGYDGVILIIDMQYRKFRVLDVGVPNDKWSIAKSNVNKYVENMASDLSAKRYYTAINYFVNAYESDYEYAISFPWIKCSLIALILGFIFLKKEKRKYRNIRKATSASNYVKEGSFRLTVKNDTFVRTYTHEVYDPPQKSSSSGGGSHHSSSGRSFGGGGGSF